MCLHVCVLCDVLWPEVRLHSDNCRVHATALRSARTLAQAYPTNNVMHLSSDKG